MTFHMTCRTEDGKVCAWASRADGCAAASTRGTQAAAAAAPAASALVPHSQLRLRCACRVFCRLPTLQVLESSRDAGEPLSFEIGAGEVMGNPLFQVGVERGMQVMGWVRASTADGAAGGCAVPCGGE